MERWACFLSFFAVCVFVWFFSFSQQLGTSQRASIPWNKSFAFKMLPRIVWWDSLLSSPDWIHLRWIDLNWERLTWPIKEGLSDINLMIKTDLTLERLILPIERLSADKPAVLWWCTIVLPAGRRLCFKPVSRKNRVGRFAAEIGGPHQYSKVLKTAKKNAAVFIYESSSSFKFGLSWES